LRTVFPLEKIASAGKNCTFFLMASVNRAVRRVASAPIFAVLASIQAESSGLRSGRENGTKRAKGFTPPTIQPKSQQIQSRGNL
jgi:hypothetical protein